MTKKKILAKGAAVLTMLLAFSFVVAGCSSTPEVARVSSDEQIDLSGYWNDTDVRIVADEVITQCLDSPRIKDYAAQHTGELPVVIVGTYRNQSDEHIDTTILTKKLEAALINSGKVNFVANADERGELRAEREDQQTNASEETAANLGNETGANYMLIGSVKTIVDSNGKKMTRTYFVSTEMIDIETNMKIWVNENDSIKKVISRPSIRP
ncbi:MAG: penicillin-binding protein activator LpoB [Treponema sp.]|nr:penicillin-binding protein activator LpoB [Treponema sp.]